MALMDALSPALLLSLVIAVSWYDFRNLRVPNRVTFILFLGGLVLHWPGESATWLLSILLVMSWYFGWMGGGDAKLWLALIWFTPENARYVAPLVFGVVFLVTGAGQIIWRWARQRKLIGISTAGAWRVIPFAAWILWVN